MKKLHTALLKSSSWYSGWHTRREHKTVHYALAILVFGLFTMHVINAIPIVEATPPILSVTPSKVDLLDVNNQLLKIAHRYDKEKNLEDKEALRGQFETIAANRKTQLLAAMATNPKTFHKFAFPKNVLKHIPDELNTYIEKDISVKGKYTIFHQHDFNDKETWQHLFTTSDGKKYYLHNEGDIYPVQDGAIVNVTGTAIDDQIMLAAPGTTATTAAIQTVVAATTPSPIGEQRTGVIIYNLTGQTPTYITPEQLRTAFFSETPQTPVSLNSYIKETSFGKAWVTEGGIYGPLTITSSLDCLTDTDLVFGQLAAQGVNRADFPRWILVGNSCGNQAYANGLTLLGTEPVQYFDRLKTYAYHEFGHTIGVGGHANSLNCGTKQIDYLENCVHIEYGDSYSAMGSLLGNGSTNFQFNAPQKTFLSWIPQANVQKITTSGTYTIYAGETAQTGPQLLSIYKHDMSGTNSIPKAYLSIEFRKPYGVDSTLPINVTSGVTVHTHFGADNTVNYPKFTRILDQTPGDDNWLHNKAILDGMTFTDPIVGVSIKQLSHTVDSATVQITFDPTICTRMTPLFTVINPGNMYGGQTKGIEVSIQNKDDVRCGPSTFTVASVTPSGWISVPTTITVNPLSSGSGVIYLTPPSNIVEGSYDVSHIVTDGTLTSHSVSQNLSYYVYPAVVTPPSEDIVAPTISINTPLNNAVFAGGTTIATSATANDNIEVTKVDFLYSGTLVCTDTTAPYSCNWKLPKVRKKIYQIRANAYDAAGNIGSAMIFVSSK